MAQPAARVANRLLTFGPLHLVPMKQSWVGPDSFRTTGEAWSDNHQLIPAGILAAPEVRHSKL
jgi:hypothetical protein